MYILIYIYSNIVTYAYDNTASACDSTSSDRQTVPRCPKPAKRRGCVHGNYLGDITLETNVVFNP